MSLNAVVFSPGGQYLFSGGDRQENFLGEIWMWDVATGEFVRKLGGVINQSWRLSAHPTEPIVIATGWEGSMKAWNYGASRRCVVAGQKSCHAGTECG